MIANGSSFECRTTGSRWTHLSDDSLAIVHTQAEGAEVARSTVQTDESPGGTPSVGTALAYGLRHRRGPRLLPTLRAAAGKGPSVAHELIAIRDCVESKNGQ